MVETPLPRTSGRETRLLLVTVAVSVAMLFLLARLRFPAQGSAGAVPDAVVTQAPAPPLERLAARATYDELAGILRGVDQTAAGAVLSLRAVPDAASSGSDTTALFVPAVRLSSDRAMALVGIGRRLQPSSDSTSAGITIVASDSPRGVALLQVPVSETTVVPRLAGVGALPRAPGYVAAIEATRGGPAVRPLYFGRLDRVPDPRWDEPVLRFSAMQQQLPTGAALFTFEGQFIGLGFPDDRDLVVIPGATLLGEAERLSRDGSVAAADLGLEVQRLDDELRAATGADAGVVVSYVAPAGPSAGQVQPGDVLREIGAHIIRSTADYTGALMQLTPSVPVTLALARHGVPTTVTATPAVRGRGNAEAAEILGLELRAVKGAGSEVVRVAPRSLAARAGILSGDLIGGIGDTDTPSPAEVDRAFARAAPGERLLVRLERGATHVIVALARP